MHIKVEGSSRRIFLKKASCLALAPTLPLISRFAHAAGSEVVVGTWGGDYQNLLQKFIEPTLAKDGLKVIYDTGGNAARTTKLKAEHNSRRGSMDVALLAGLEMYDVNAVGALAAVSVQHVPNLVHVMDKFKTAYSVPHIFSAMGLVYNKEKFDTPPDSIQVLLDPKYKGRVGLVDNNYVENMLFAGLAEGGKGESFEPGMKFLDKLKANQPKVFPSNETLAAAIKSGEIWVACMWKARALQWRDAGLPVEFAIPREGAIPVTFLAAVPKNSRNPENAWKYLNAMLDPEGQVHFARAMGYAPTVKNARLPADLQARVAFTEAELARLYPPDVKELVKQRAAGLDFWNTKFKAGL